MKGAMGERTAGLDGCTAGAGEKTNGAGAAPCEALGGDALGGLAKLNAGAAEGLDGDGGLNTKGEGAAAGGDTGARAPKEKPCAGAAEKRPEAGPDDD